jgi:hypothetical protein
MESALKLGMIFLPGLRLRGVRAALIFSLFFVLATLTRVEWEAQLDECKVRGVEARLAITEAALLGYLVDRGLPEDFVILSDDAGQFNILIHALC